MVVSLPKNIKIWGLTGGIGSGKSLAAKFFEELGIPAINLDFLGREILDTDPTVHEELKNLFGPKIIKSSQVDRSAIREIIFKNPEKREELEKILHPKIWREFFERAQAKSKEGFKVILCEAALLIEHNHAKLFPKLIVVTASEATRKKRVIARDKMSEELFDAVLKTQVNDTIRKQTATDLLNNDGTEIQLKNSIKDLVTSWKKGNLI
ncbi:MAG: dephospho-CoA kinase [Proteobacteria bacterium]|nr:dephospho-CoA kinase [Pseudomonadota bacterium]